MGFLDRAIPLAAFIELGEDGTPLDALRLLALVELLQLLVFGLDIAGKLDFGGAEIREPVPRRNDDLLSFLFFSGHHLLALHLRGLPLITDAGVQGCSLHPNFSRSPAAGCLKVSLFVSRSLFSKNCHRLITPLKSLDFKTLCDSNARVSLVTVVKYVAAKTPRRGENLNVDALFCGRAPVFIPGALGVSFVNY